MLSVYLAALAFGLVLIGASVFTAGGHDAHHDVAALAPSDHADHPSHQTAEPHPIHGDALSAVFSLRFWSYALGAFGMAGAALAALGLPASAHLPAASGVGVVAGSTAAWLFRRVARATVGVLPGVEGLLGAEGEVVLALREERLGKIRVRIDDRDVELLAKARPRDDLGAKSRVVVVRIDDGIAHVAPAPWSD